MLHSYIQAHTLFVEMQVRNLHTGIQIEILFCRPYQRRAGLILTPPMPVDVGVLGEEDGFSGRRVEVSEIIVVRLAGSSTLARDHRCTASGGLPPWRGC
ncbi:hypothetical protein SASPL_106959 [Salvia splendens]|uniref:Uncharacterized protein n=1 Tax=Salvia splendens TaxID=180675 RepID=A0A8X8YBJ0_SALSN|nr:hypothetical protein SASPL_106959 [Salvia splendens]